ncbi:MAG: hypothetical protein ACE5D1_09675, partial [Fidelibacterota bacterium]
MSEQIDVDTLDAKQEPVSPDDKTRHVDDHAKPDPEIIALRRRIKEEADKRRALEEKLKSEEEEKLKEKEEFKTLYEKTKAEVDAYKVKAEQLDKYEQMERERILEMIPEDKRDRYTNLGLQALKVVEEDFLNNKPNPPRVDNSSPGASVSGFESLMDAAEAFKRGEIDTSAYASFNPLR